MSNNLLRVNTGGSLIDSVKKTGRLITSPTEPSTADSEKYMTWIDSVSGNLHEYDGVQWVQQTSVTLGNIGLDNTHFENIGSPGLGVEGVLVEPTQNQNIDFRLIEGDGVYTTVTIEPNDNLRVSLQPNNLLLGDLGNVDTVIPPLDGQVLKYDSGSLKWKPGTDTASLAMNDLTDVNAPAPPENALLYFNNANEYVTTPAGTTLGDVLTSQGPGLPLSWVSARDNQNFGDHFDCNFSAGAKGQIVARTIDGNNWETINIGTSQQYLRVSGSGVPRWETTRLYNHEDTAGIASAGLAGDLIYRDGIASFKRLAILSDGYVLTTNLGLPTWLPLPAPKLSFSFSSICKNAGGINQIIYMPCAPDLSPADMGVYVMAKDSTLKRATLAICHNTDQTITAGSLNLYAGVVNGACAGVNWVQQGFSIGTLNNGSGVNPSIVGDNLGYSFTAGQKVAFKYTTTGDFAVSNTNFDILLTCVFEEI